MAATDEKKHNQVFISVRFDRSGAKESAKLLQNAIQEEIEGVRAFLAAPSTGADITTEVFTAMENSVGFIVMGGSTYGEDTKNPASTFEEIKYWRATMQAKHPGGLFPINMLKSGEKEHSHIQARLIFGNNDSYDVWPIGTPLPPSLLKHIKEKFQPEWAGGRSEAGGDEIGGGADDEGGTGVKNLTDKFNSVGTYEGQLVDGKAHGTGTWTWSHAFGVCKYTREFEEDKRHGQGTYTFPTGDKYVGDFKDDVMHGTGTYTSAAMGFRHEGQFKFGFANGPGVRYNVNDNSVIFRGEFKNNMPVQNFCCTCS